MSHPGNRPDPETTQDRDAEIWRLRVEEKLTVRKIGERVNVSHSTVCESLARTADKHSEQFRDRVRQVKEEQTEQLVEAAYEAWQAWAQSKKPAESFTRRMEKLAQAGDGGSDEKSPDPEDIPNLYLDDDGEEVSAEERARKIYEFALSKGQGGLPLFKDIATSKVEGRTGDPRHLANFLKACEDIRKIWGADAPTKTEVTGADGGAILMKHFEVGLDRVYGTQKGSSAPEG